jgi:hypothetical protein
VYLCWCSVAVSTPIASFWISAFRRHFSNPLFPSLYTSAGCWAGLTWNRFFQTNVWPILNDPYHINQLLELWTNFGDTLVHFTQADSLSSYVLLHCDSDQLQSMLDFLHFLWKKGWSRSDWLRKENKAGVKWRGKRWGYILEENRLSKHGLVVFQVV